MCRVWVSRNLLAARRVRGRAIVSLIRDGTPAKGSRLPSRLVLARAIVPVRATGTNVAAGAAHLLLQHATLVIIIIAHAHRATIHSNLAGVLTVNLFLSFSNVSSAQNERSFSCEKKIYANIVIRCEGNFIMIHEFLYIV